MLSLVGVPPLIPQGFGPEYCEEYSSDQVEPDQKPNHTQFRRQEFPVHPGIFQTIETTRQHTRVNSGRTDPIHQRKLRIDERFHPPADPKKD